MLGKKILPAALAWMVSVSLAGSVFGQTAPGVTPPGVSPSGFARVSSLDKGSVSVPIYEPTFQQVKADQPAAKDAIRLPIAQESPPAPMPATVDQVVKLQPGVRYVVESDVECLVFLSPGGSVSVKKQLGPITIDTKFYGGSGVEEEREFKGKYIYSFKAIKDGRDELIIVPVGAKSEAEAKRVTFQVGQLPQPPPVPVDPVAPVAPSLTKFQQSLVASIKADAATSEQVKLYAALWRQAANTTVQDATLATGAELLAEMKVAVKALGLPVGSLAKTARTVADELNVTLSKTGKLDAATRASITALFARISVDLETAGGVK